MSKLKIEIEQDNKLLKKELEFKNKEIELLNKLIEQITIHKDREVMRNDKLYDFLDEMEKHLDNYDKELFDKVDLIKGSIDVLRDSYCERMNQLIKSTKEINTPFFTIEDLEASNAQLKIAESSLERIASLFERIDKKISDLDNRTLDDLLEDDELDLDFDDYSLDLLDDDLD